MGFGETVEKLIKDHRSRVLREQPGPLGDFWRAGGGDVLLRDAKISADDTVLDVGAFSGSFTTEVSWRFGARCVAVEPVPSFCEDLRTRFSRNSRISIIEAAVGGCDGEVALQVQQDGTSAFAEPRENTIRVRQIDVASLVQENSPVALLKLNIEGAEYDVLERILSSGLQHVVRSLLVQFHRVRPDSARRREQIRRTLLLTHREAFCYDFVWERWDLR